MDQRILRPFKSFFDNWSTYDKLIYYNYMLHNEIHAVLGDFLRDTVPDEFCMLDLGCGNCSQIAKTLKGTGIKHYIGVDLSYPPLEKAATYFEDLGCNTELIEDDYMHYFSNCEKEHFEVVLSGYSVHHLYYNDKQSFFDNCYRTLKNGGYFVHYDVVRLHEETREQYIQRYYSKIDEWANLDKEEIATVKEHIKQYDFPSSYEELVFMAVNSGFTVKPGRLYSDKHRIHTLSCFLKK